MMESNSLILTAGVLVCLLLAITLFAVLIRLRGRSTNVTTAPEHRKSERTPLERLEPTDISFLSEHPALARTCARELRRERRKILREYLCALRLDFDKTCADIKAAIVSSAVDRPDLVHAILKQQVLFKLGLMRAECSMMLEALGLAEVEFEVIADALGSIRFKVTRLLVPVQPQVS
jgi:hypothetical protein